MSAASTDQLAWEARAGRLAAAAAALSAALLLVGSVYFNSTVSDQTPRRIDQEFALYARESTAFVVSGVLIALAFLALSGALAYLYRATRERRKEVPSAALALLLLGAAVAAGAEVAWHLAIVDIAHAFLGSSIRSPDRAVALTSESGVFRTARLLQLGSYGALAIALVLLSTNAMRAGLVSRFIGVLGIVIGALFVVASVLFPLRGVVFLLLAFWLFALATLFLDRWPGGRGPAWTSGEAEPWPTVSQRNAELKRRRDDLDRDGDTDEAEGSSEAETPGQGGGAAAEARRATPASAADSASTGNGVAAAQRGPKRKRGRRS